MEHSNACKVASHGQCNLECIAAQQSLKATDP
jgi:hypothetical protein